MFNVNGTNIQGILHLVIDVNLVLLFKLDIRERCRIEAVPESKQSAKCTSLKQLHVKNKNK